VNFISSSFIFYAIFFASISTVYLDHVIILWILWISHFSLL